MTTVKDTEVTADITSGSKIEPLVKFDVADHLDSPEVLAAYLSEFFEEGDPAMIAEALGDASRAKGMAEVASQAGLARESLYKALRPGSQPRLETILRVLRALGMQLVVQPISNVGSDQESDGPKV
ncbi:addiction module antidote protein [Massilia sp.]|uniref:addiction module antidote protein n=1 Tax=Massilia sp. TaxID=1882437 RepID=UPI00289F3A34|nr:addiction module antidote protein [Massilia sp.]